MSSVERKGQKTRTVHYGQELRRTLATYCKVLGYVPKNSLIESIKDPGRPLSSKAQRKTLAKQRLFDQQADGCPCCGQGKMVIICVFAPNKDPPLTSFPFLQCFLPSPFK